MPPLTSLLGTPGPRACSPSPLGNVASLCSRQPSDRRGLFQKASLAVDFFEKNWEEPSAEVPSRPREVLWRFFSCPRSLPVLQPCCAWSHTSSSLTRCLYLFSLILDPPHHDRLAGWPQPLGNGLALLVTSGPVGWGSCTILSHCPTAPQTGYVGQPRPAAPRRPLAPIQPQTSRIIPLRREESFLPLRKAEAN